MKGIFRIAIAVSLFSFHAMAGDSSHDEHEEELYGGVGPGMAVLKADSHVGIQLSDKALSRLGIVTQKIAALPLGIPRSSLVFFQEDVGVYRLRSGWFKLVTLATLASGHAELGFIPANSADFKVGDEIVVSGAALLRVAELDALGGDEEGHGH